MENLKNLFVWETFGPYLAMLRTFPGSVLSSDTLPMFGRLYVVQGIEWGSTTCKASTLTLLFKLKIYVLKFDK